MEAKPEVPPSVEAKREVPPPVEAKPAVETKVPPPVEVPDGLATLGPPCGSFTFMNSATSGRTRDTPYGFQKKA